MQIRLFLKEFRDSKSFIVKKNQDIYHYLANVLRIKVSNLVYFFNGLDDFDYCFRVSAIDKNQISFDYQNKILNQSPKFKFFVNLCFCPPKHDLETIIRQSTELGVSNITILDSQRTIVKKPNFSRLEKISIEAAEQCGRNNLVNFYDKQLNFNQIFEYIKNNFQDFQNIVLFCNEKLSDQNFSDYLIINNKNLPKLDTSKLAFFHIIIGPEGGFTDYEINLIDSFSKNNQIHNDNIKFVAISLSQNILKVDTAAIKAISGIFDLYTKSNSSS